MIPALVQADLASEDINGEIITFRTGITKHKRNEYRNSIISRELYSNPSWFLVGRALHPYRRGHGFESRSGLSFFQALISKLLQLCV